MTELSSQAPPPPPPPQAFPPLIAPGGASPYGSSNLKSPGLAGLFSFLPGLGHVYLGLYQRAGLMFGVFALLCTIGDHMHRHEGPIVLLTMFWWFFSLIDAVRQAKAINATGAPEPNLVTKESTMKLGGSLVFGVFLILFGLFFLLDRFVTIDLSIVLDWWPLLIVAFGAWQVYAYLKAKQTAAQRDETTSP